MHFIVAVRAALLTIDCIIPEKKIKLKMWRKHILTEACSGNNNGVEDFGNVAVSWVGVSFWVGIPDWAWGPGNGMANQGTEESVLQVQLIPSFAGTDIESRHMSFSVMMLLSVLEPMLACRVPVRQSVIDTYCWMFVFIRGLGLHVCAVF